ncbi:PREDICTED: BLOC-1-related complex subunit 6-like [Nicotiana attenuata]|uniref:BLOC-1-related complex subunit 6-like n=1 Tax=Nicotiana attenuata TaxID=49451 RepID=UPI0009051855|nr:PREDICTED: BLOC-1-related complex subunit 6-like [Nicotiana attenuata]
MAPKKKARIGQGANATLGVADDSLLDVAEQTTPAPTPAEGATIPPVDTLVLPPAPASDSDHFLPAETRAARAAEFENLKQGNKSVWEYHMEFARLSKYAIHMLPTREARVRRFVQGLNSLTINEVSTAALNSDMNYEKMVAFSQATESRKLKNRIEREGNSKARSTGNMGESQGGGRSAFRGGSSGPSQSIAQPGQGHRGSHQRGRSGERSQQQQRSPCPRCGKMHSGICNMELPICYGCGMRGHIQRHCRVSRQGAGRGTAQPSSPAAATSSAPSPARGSPAPAGRGAARGGAQSSGGPSRFYAMSGRQTTEASPDQMAPKKKARIGQGANATPGVADDSLLDVAGEGSRPAITLPDPSIPEQTTPAPTPTEGTTIPPVDTLVPPPAPASDALSRKSMGSLAHLGAYQRPLAREVYQLASLGVRLADSNKGGIIIRNRAESSLVAEVKEKQFNDPLLT